MEQLQGSQHPSLLLKKCDSCNFILKNHLHLATPDAVPHWDLFCPNLSCFNFGKVAVRYTFARADGPPTTDSKLFPDTDPDTSIESD